MGSYDNRENDSLYLKIKGLLIDNPNLGRYTLSQKTGASEKACRNRLKWYKMERGCDIPKEKTNDSRRFDCRGDTAEVTFLSDKLCVTTDDVMLKGAIDRDTWKVDRFILNSWGSEKKPMWQVKAWISKKVIDPDEIIQAVTDRMKEYSPTVPTFHTDLKKTGYMWELDIMDLHVGKFAWKPETGNNWDIKLSVKANNKAVDELLGRALSMGIEFEQILMPIGNDLLHVDNMLGQTTAGTKQDTDGRVLKMFKVTLDMMIQQIDRLKTIAPVHVPIMAGNHDLLSTMYLGIALWGCYRNDANVTVDYSPISRKYHQFGKCLIGYCHGCREDPNTRDLPLIMAQECPAGWVKAIHKAWHIGHTHKSKQVSFIAEDTFQGVVVRTIRSLTATDLWHFNHGYINPNARGAEAFVWHKEDGMVQHNISYARDK